MSALVQEYDDVATYARSARPTGAYARLSKAKGDQRGGGSLAIERQRDDCHEYVAEAGLNGRVLDYTDDGYSAFDATVTRPAWTRLLDDIRAGKLGAVVAWHVDRLTRQPLEFELLWAACKASKTQLHIVGVGVVIDATMLRIQATLAAKESEDKQRRIGRKHMALAREGKFHGGRRRFGYTADMSALVDDEANVIRDVAARLLGGESLASVARDLDAQGIPTAQGGKWTGPNLRTMMLRPHLAAKRVHQGVTTRATWPRVLDDAVHEALVYKLGDPSRRTSHSNARVYLLAGLATCDECGLPLRGRPTYSAKVEDGQERPRAYACESGRHVHRPVALVDEVVTARIVERLARLTDLGVFQDDAAVTRIAQLEDALNGVEERREKTRQRYAAGRISDQEYDADLDALSETRERLSNELAEARSSLRPHDVLDGVTGSQIAAERFRSLALGRQREIVSHLLTDVRLRKAPRRGAEFTPHDVITVWRTLP